MPFKSKLSSVITTRSIRCFCNNARTSDISVPSLTVISLSCGVITFSTVSSRRVSNLTSRPVTRPTIVLPFTTGRAEILCCCCMSNTSLTVALGEIVIGSRIMPDSNLLTFLTSLACSSVDMFL